MYTLSPQSKKVAEALQDKLVLTAFEGGVNPADQTPARRIPLCRARTRRDAHARPDKEPSTAEQMKITTVPSLHIQYGKESFVVTQPTEETITNGIIRVTRPGKKVVYFTEGFGEAGMEDAQDPKGFASLKLALEQENYEVKPLLLPSVEQIPDDASVVVLRRSTPLATRAITAPRGLPEARGRLFTPWSGRTGAATRRAEESRASSATGRQVGNDIVIDREVRLFEEAGASFRSPARTAPTPSRRGSATSRSIRRPPASSRRPRGRRGSRPRRW